MQDQILKSYVEDFSKDWGYSDLRDDDVFERFVNYCIVSKQYPRDFDIEALSVGGGNDTGFDGVAIIANGNILQSKEEIDYLIDRNGYLDISFVFIQSKSSKKFKGDQIGTLIFGLRNFFDETSSIPENEEVKNLRSIKEKAYSNTISFDRAPVLDISFVTTGSWQEPEHIVGRVKRELKELEKQNLFSEIKFNFVDAEKLKETYRELRRKTVKEISFSNNVALPDISNVRQSFVGSLSVKEYIDLITDSEGHLQKSLFEDNVRDFQGKNKVNADIENTIQDSQIQAALAILNNGITIIAKKVEPIGGKMKLTDFQIVNGCQSSHVIYENRSRILEGTHIVVKIIETTDQDLSSRVIQATNRQTLVTDEAFESLTSFHKDLEEFYKAHSRDMDYPIYYERRSKQYESVPSVPASQVISLGTQINAYVSTHFGQPHSTHRYYGELLDANRSKIFRAKDPMEPYFISSLGLNRLERAFKAGKLERKYKPFKYQILFLAHTYHLILKKKKNDYGFKEIIGSYCSIDECKRIFGAACSTITSQLKASKMSPKDAVRSREFTGLLKSEMEKIM